jgi:hypothetical protein
MSNFALFLAASAADKAWMDEIAPIFGDREAGMARFHGHATGEPGSHLSHLYQGYVSTRDAYNAARRH